MKNSTLINHVSSLLLSSYFLSSSLTCNSSDSVLCIWWLEHRIVFFFFCFFLFFFCFIDRYEREKIEKRWKCSVVVDSPPLSAILCRKLTAISFPRTTRYMPCTIVKSYKKKMDRDIGSWYDIMVKRGARTCVQAHICINMIYTKNKKREKEERKTERMITYACATRILWIC